MRFGNGDGPQSPGTIWSDHQMRRGLIGMIEEKDASRVSHLVHDGWPELVFAAMEQIIVIPHKSLNGLHPKRGLQRAATCITFVVPRQGEPVDIAFAFIADAVEVVNGKLYVMGGCWESLSATSYPTTVRIAIVMRLRVGPGDQGEHRFAIRFADQAGAELPPGILGNVQITAVAPQGGFISSGLNHLLTLPHAGRYTVQIAIDDRLCDWPLSFEAQAVLPS